MRLPCARPLTNSGKRMKIFIWICLCCTEAIAGKTTPVTDAATAKWKYQEAPCWKPRLSSSAAAPPAWGRRAICACAARPPRASLRARSLPDAQPCVLICKTSYVREGGVGFAEGMVNEDNEFVIRSMTADGRCAMVPDTCYGYLVREGSVTTDQSKGLARLRAHMYLSDFCRARAYAARDAGEDGLCEAFSMLDEWFVDCAVEACDSMVDGFPSTPLWPDNVMAAADQRECYWRLWQRQNIIRIQEGSIADLDAKLAATRAELDESRRETAA